MDTVQNVFLITFSLSIEIGKEILSGEELESENVQTSNGAKNFFRQNCLFKRFQPNIPLPGIRFPGKRFQQNCLFKRFQPNISFPGIRFPGKDF